jgi:hypothetical protein
VTLAVVVACGGTAPDAVEGACDDPMAPSSDESVVLPAPTDVVSMRWTSIDGTEPWSLEVFRAWLAAAHVVPRCDASLAAWSYAPAQSGVLETSRGKRYEIRLFHGGRAFVTDSSGRRVVLDAGR